MAQAMADVMRRVGIGAVHHHEPNGKSSDEVKEDQVNYIPIKEINLDDNGLKDASFAAILSSLRTQPHLRRISYVNNEIGSKSVEELEKLISSAHEGQVNDVRITRVKTSKHDLNMLLRALS